MPGLNLRPSVFSVVEVSQASWHSVTYSCHVHGSITDNIAFTFLSLAFHFVAKQIRIDLVLQTLRSPVLGVNYF